MEYAHPSNVHSLPSPCSVSTPCPLLVSHSQTASSPPLFLGDIAMQKWRQEGVWLHETSSLHDGLPHTRLVPVQTSGQTVMNRICPLSRCSYDTPHQPPALTDQDIQCHPQDLTQYTVKYKTMNGTDVDNTHNIQCNLTANIVVQFKRLQCILF